ncbi:MAG TPA: TraR/DksA C4-type zinc finger protein [Gemmataceae bacterium]|nr:TraR/DksA C4-type zinc finger protein [Gemmataceae bacterium]
MPVKVRPCRRCGAAIPPERLEALPDTTICVKCSEAVGGEFEVTVVPEDLGKGGSLKKNYGGWTVRRRRRSILPE